MYTLLRFQHTKHGSKQARKVRKKIKTIAGRLIQEINRTFNEQRLLLTPIKNKKGWEAVLKQRNLAFNGIVVKNSWFLG